MKLLNKALERDYIIHIVSLTYRQFTDTIIRKLRDLYSLDVSRLASHGPALIVDSNGVLTGEILFDTVHRVKTSFCIECSVCKRYIVRVYGSGRIVSIGDARPDACMFVDSDYAIAVNSHSTRTIVRVNADFVARDLERDLDKIYKFL